MRRSAASSGGQSDFEIFPIIPILMALEESAEEVEEGLGWTKYKCPFHGDTTPSASVNTTDQIFNCHVYDKCPSGTATQIIMKQEGLTYREAVQRAQEILGAGYAPVRRASGRSSRGAGGSRNRSGTRAFKRTWSGPESSGSA